MKRPDKLLACAMASVLIASSAYGAELRIGVRDDPDLLDPAQAGTLVGRIVFASLCDKLVDVGSDLNMVPQLATKWEWSDNGKTLSMDLRQDVLFHDGTPFNAAAAVYTIDRNMTLPESRRKSELRSIAKVEATSEYQIRFTLKNADASLLAQLSDRAGMMISPTAGKKLGSNFGARPVCSGPFKFVNRVQQDRIVLEKFADYWDKDKIFLDKVIFLPIVDTTVRLANVQSGDLDMAERISASDTEAVKNDPALNYGEVIGLGYISVFVNVGNGAKADNPFAKDKRLRHAFSLAIDREALNQVALEGKGLVGNQPWPPTSKWYDKDIPVPARDVEKAKALLKEAGYDRVPVEMMHVNNTPQTQMMQALQAMVAEAGFDVTLKPTEYATYISEQATGNYVLARSDWSGRPDPDGNIHQFATCDAGMNDTRYCNPEVDKLLTDARSETDSALRKVKYDAVTKLLDDDLPIIYLLHEPYLYATSKKVTGFTPSFDGMIRLKGVRKDD